MTSQRASSCLAPTFPGRERVLCAFLFLLCPLDRCERNAKAGPPRQHFGLCVRLSPCDHAEHAKSLLGKPREARAACATGTQLRRRGDRLDWSFAALGGRRAAVWRRVRTRAPGARRYLHVINIFLSATTPVRRPSFAPHASALLLCGRARSAAVYFQAFPSLPPSFLSLSLFRAVPQEIRSPCTGASPKRLAGEQRKNWPLPRSGGSCPPLSVRKHVFCLCVVARLARIVVRKSEAVDAEGWSLGPHVHCKPWSVLKEKVATAYD